MRASLKLTIFAVLFSFGAGVGIILGPNNVAAQSATKGCWSQGGSGACDWCGNGCASNQKCCKIVVE